jgi:hypothetical protein
MRNLIAACSVAALIAGVAAAQTAKSQTVNGLQITVTGVERMEKASLRDCPPGTNTVNAVERPGDQLSVVKLAFKVPAGFKGGPMKRPVATAADGTKYNTSVQFVDVGSMPEYSCEFVYRVPRGTVLKTLQVESATFDLPPLADK